MLMSKEKAEALGIKGLAKILSFADAQQEPDWFTTTPSIAMPKAAKKAGMDIKNMDLYEINEAFSVVSIANNQLMGLDPAKGEYIMVARYLWATRWVFREHVSSPH